MFLQLICESGAELRPQAKELLSFRRVIECQWTCFHGVVRFLIAEQRSTGVSNNPATVTYTVAPFEFLSLATSHHSLIHPKRRGFAHSSGILDFSRHKIVSIATRSSRSSYCRGMSSISRLARRVETRCHVHGS